jgi:ABC-2 type transport system permease protein
MTMTVTTRAVTVIAHRELLKQFSQRSALVTQAIQMVFFLLLYVVGFGGMIGSVGDVPFGSYVFPGIVAIHLVTTGMSAGITFAWDREYGFMREMLVAPIPRLTVPVGKTAGITVQAVVQSVVLLLLAPFVGLELTRWSFLLALGVCALTAIVFCSIGLLLATVISRIAVLQGVIQLAMFPLLFLSGSVFRPDQVPHWLAAGMRANPMTYAVDLLRQALLPATASFPRLLTAWGDLGVLAAILVVAVAGTRLRMGR